MSLPRLTQCSHVKNEECKAVSTAALSDLLAGPIIYALCRPCFDRLVALASQLETGVPSSVARA